MKRCPQCEFIYEDEQSLCDMDGVLLVFDSRTLPNMNALTAVTTKPAPKRHLHLPQLFSPSCWEWFITSQPSEKRRKLRTRQLPSRARRILRPLRVPCKWR